MRIVFISDTHSNRFSDLLPEGDLLIHAGDFSVAGSIKEVAVFNLECEKALPKYTHGIYVSPGNHDFLAESDRFLCQRILTNANLVLDESFELEGIKFYASPHQPVFFEWAFNQEPDVLEYYWSLIPTETDVLITHGPPKGRLDLTVRGQYVGCDLLADRIKELEALRLHCFGHIHNGYGYEWNCGKLYVNASMCDNRNWLVNPPIVVDIDPQTKECTLVR